MRILSALLVSTMIVPSLAAECTNEQIGWYMGNSTALMAEIFGADGLAKCLVEMGGGEASPDPAKVKAAYCTVGTSCNKVAKASFTVADNLKKEGCTLPAATTAYNPADTVKKYNDMCGKCLVLFTSHQQGC
jgi:hypothetical protein